MGNCPHCNRCKHQDWGTYAAPDFECAYEFCLKNAKPNADGTCAAFAAKEVGV